MPCSIAEREILLPAGVGEKKVVIPDVPRSLRVFLSVLFLTWKTVVGSYGGREGFSLLPSHNENCVLRATEIVCFPQRKLCASPNILRSREIVHFARNENCVLCSTEIGCFAQQKLGASFTRIGCFALGALLNRYWVLRPMSFA